MTILDRNTANAVPAPFEAVSDAVSTTLSATSGPGMPGPGTPLSKDAPKSRLADMLSPHRAGKDAPDAIVDYRSPFEIDADRIQFSRSFRALADKTQVHGPSGDDYVRSRLTHSIEVSRVGRSLGSQIGRILARRAGPDRDWTAGDIGHVVAAAGLMHDIGNPPFGHTGEDIISDFFRDHPTGRKLLKGLSPRMQVELTHFEGNAQGFRVVSRLQGWRPEGGLQLTAATQAAFAKYPFAADTAIGTRRTKCKYGFYESEAAEFSRIAELTGMVPAGRELAWRRHPLAYLVEVADDVCYRVVDVEDGAMMNIITMAEAEDMLLPLACPDLTLYRSIEPMWRKLEFLRSRAIQTLIDAVASGYEDVADQIEDGSHPGDLLLGTVHGEHLQAVSKFSRERIYRNAARLRLDAEAADVLNRLLVRYCEAFLARERKGDPVLNDPAFQIPAFARSISLVHVPMDRAGWLRAMLDFISGLTDRGALALDRQFNHQTGT